MANVDIQAAYRCIPVRSSDWPMLGMRWGGRYYFHKTLVRASLVVPPMGALRHCGGWILKHVCGVRDIVHYVDDSFLAAATQRDCNS